MKHEISKLTKKDKEWIEQKALYGKTICEAYSLEEKDLVSTIDLDLAFKSWKEDKNPEKFSNTEIIQGLGCLFGQLMCLQFDLQWNIVKDNFGTDFVLLHPVKTWETYPLDFVAKRAYSGEDEGNFFQAMQKLMQDELYSA